VVNVLGERGVGVVEEGANFHDGGSAIRVGVFVDRTILVESSATSRK
jgi:hypothetical protein